MTTYTITVTPQAGRYLARLTTVEPPGAYDWREGPSHKLLNIALADDELEAVYEVMKEFLRG